MPKKYKPKKTKSNPSILKDPMKRITKLNDNLRKKPTGPGRGKV